MSEAAGDPKPKYQELVEDLASAIRSGTWQPGQKLPSEAMLVRQYKTSRITVGRAMRELQHLGLIDRVAGSGSFVRAAVTQSVPAQLVFGLLIPDLGETEIFGPICNGIATATAPGDHALLWGHNTPGSSKPESALHLCRQFVNRGVSGVFFAPLEFEPEAAEVNARILARLAEAGIPVVLLDRRASAPSQGKRHDLVGVNNHQAAYIATAHLIELGCRNIAFLGSHGAAVTMTARYAGYRDALAAHGLLPNSWEVRGPGDLPLMPSDASKRPGAVEGYVCVNDRVAGELMQALLSRGVRVPDDVRVVGIDDVSYASMLPVPLTTVRQPCREIGAAALATMLSRMADPGQPARELLFDGELIVRQSCGAGLDGSSNQR